MINFLTAGSPREPHPFPRQAWAGQIPIAVSTLAPRLTPHNVCVCVYIYIYIYYMYVYIYIYMYLFIYIYIYIYVPNISVYRRPTPTPHPHTHPSPRHDSAQLRLSLASPASLAMNYACTAAYQGS